VNRRSVCVCRKVHSLKNVCDLDLWTQDLDNVISVMWVIVVMSFIKIRLRPCIREIQRWKWTQTHHRRKSSRITTTGHVECFRRRLIARWKHKNSVDNIIITVSRSTLFYSLSGSFSYGLFVVYYASFDTRMPVHPPVRPSVRHTPEWHLHGSRYRSIFYTIDVCNLLMPNFVVVSLGIHPKRVR